MWKTANTEGLETEDLKNTNHFLDDERTRGIYYTQFERKPVPVAARSKA